MALGSIVRHWGAADYEPDLRFYDRVCAVGYRLQEEGDRWETDRISVRLLNCVEHTQIVLAHKRVGYEGANPGDYDRETNRMTARTLRAVTGLGIKNLTRMGFKTSIFVDVGLPFAELVKRVGALCVTTEKRFTDLTSPNLKDVGLIVDYTRAEFSAMLRVGPMERKQGLQFIGHTGSIESIFKPLTESEDIVRFYNNVPDAFLYFDIDVFKEGQLPVEGWTSFVDAARVHCVEVFQGIKEMVTEGG